MSEKSLEKKKLIEARERYRKELQHEVRDITDQANQALKTVLIIGGALAAGYIVAKQFTRSSRKKAKNKTKDSPDTVTEAVEEYSTGPSLLSIVGERIVTEASFLLLDLAKDKIREYLEARKNEDEDLTVDSGE